MDTGSEQWLDTNENYEKNVMVTIVKKLINKHLIDRHKLIHHTHQLYFTRLSFVSPFTIV